MRRKHNIKKLLSSILILVMVAGMLPISSMKAQAEPVSNPQCRIGDHEYYTIASALIEYTPDSESIDNPTVITLIKDVNEAVTIPENRFITLDLNGYVLSATNSTVITVNGVLTITDSAPNSEHNFIVGSNGLWLLTSEDCTVSYTELTDSPDIGAIIKVNGGCITGGVSNHYDAGFGNSGGGLVINSDATVTMKGGNIIGNLANIGGGVSNYGTFNLTGGKIIGNICNYYHGGGIVNSGVFNMSSGAVSFNTGIDLGGGLINLGYCTSTISGGEFIGNMTTNTNRGGGAFDVSSGSLTITGGTFKNNFAAGMGGAVYIEGGELTITGGTFTENAAVSNGGCLYMAGGSVTLGGNVSIYGNTLTAESTANNIELSTDKVLSISSTNPPAWSTPIGITSAGVPSEGNPVALFDASGTNYGRYFASDDPEFFISKFDNVLSLVVASDVVEEETATTTTTTTTTETTPAAPSETITATVTGDSSLNVSAAIYEDKAVIADISRSSVNSLIAAGTADTLSIDISAAKETIRSVSLSKETFKMLSEVVNDDNNNIDSITIKTTHAVAEIDAAALEAVLSQATGSDIQLTVITNLQNSQLTAKQQEALSGKEVLLTFEAYFMSGGQRISSFNSGSAVLSFSPIIPAGKNANYYHVYYLQDDGAMTLCATRYNKGRLEFTAAHFSDYCIIYDESFANAAVETAAVTQTGYTVENGDCFWSIARKLNLNVIDLMSMNSDIASQKYIYAGQMLTVLK